MATQQQLLSALQALYHGDPAVKDQANKWLEAFQQSAEAWQVSNDILHAPGAGMEAHYFAAQTLRTKVQRDFEELPAGAAGALRDSLVALLVQHCSGSAAVRTQLCLAVAALAAHLPAVQWGPSGVVGWLAQRLGGEPQTVSLPCMLELLTVLPQEASSYQPAVRPERRRAVIDEMMAYAPQALQILSGCLSAPLPRAQEQVLDAFTSWLKLTGGVGLTGPMLMQSPLVRAALEGLRSADTFFSAVDAVVELIYCTSQRGRPKDDMAPLVQLIVPEVMALKPRFHVCLQQALAERNGTSGVPEGEHDDSEEDAKGMARLFAEVGEAYTGLIAEGGPQVSAPVEALLDVASHPDDSICSMSFNFWHRLSRALTIGLHPEPLESEEGPVSDEERQRRVALFTPTLERLVALIRGRVRFHENFDSWHRDERSDFKRARVAVGDTLIDCASVLGGGRMLQLLVEPLLELSKQVTSGGQFDWRTAEAALYCIRAVHRCAPLPGDGLMMSLFGSLPMLPAVAQLQYTVALAVGAYADWLADTARRSEEGRTLLSQLLTMLTRFLSEPEASSASALSIRRLCDGCAPLLAGGGSMDALMGLYRQVQASGDVAQNRTELDLDEDDVQQLIEGVTLVASALPDGQRQQCVQQMLDIVVQPMQGILQAAAAEPGGSGPGTPTAAGGGAAPTPPAATPGSQLALVLPLMERVTTVFRAVKDPADVAEALVRLWPWIEAALDRFAGDAPAIERICRAPRYAVRSAGKAAAPAVPLLVASLPQRFESSRQPCFLYVASELIKTFGDEPARDLELGGMFSRMLGAACSMLHSLHDISERPDVADDTFLLAGRALSYAPRLLLTPQLLAALLDSALAGLLVQHREACCSILAFVVRLLDPATHRACAPEAVAHLQGALVPRAPLLVRLVLAGVTGALPTNRLAELADVLYALLKVTNQNGLQWVGEALAAIPDDAATSGDKQRFMGACQKVVADGMTVNNERLVQQGVDELSELCRRNRRAAQLAQRALLPPELHYVVR
ncbi:hypothetical protein CHLNCDRAFT_134668 [Chlorella variabilis]|uniref:Importin N-terminal domain-containing protein n=1 Tax=Chlorella variabilis TaxID=554065 RepID=E1ZGH3_CHLVA|nr:hypothetical protein CHLNCDRAFT_134668 [Chlorella variabilis]EFN54933.1 hypothetical protein CHLNCDRAFT_134668 [Chlorella variabilis]|eukprot:XP_005847035.1 hypothetical protein CHLNCDRAFT_134668 [Chlorella variabilis]